MAAQVFSTATGIDAPTSETGDSPVLGQQELTS
jgi:hypothetical protein